MSGSVSLSNFSGVDPEFVRLVRTAVESAIRGVQSEGPVPFAIVEDLVKNTVSEAIGTLEPHGVYVAEGGQGVVGRFQIGSETTEDDEGVEDTHPTLVNRYIDIAGKTFEADSPGDLESYYGYIMCLQVTKSTNGPSFTYTMYSDLQGLQTAQGDNSRYTVPLYKFGESGSVECDFRIGPPGTLWEM